MINPWRLVYKKRLYMIIYIRKFVPLQAEIILKDQD